MTQIEVTQPDEGSPGEQYVVLMQDGGVIRQEDGSLRLFYKPF